MPNGVTVTPRSVILRVVDELMRYGKYDFRSDGFIKIEKWRRQRAISEYRSTLTSMRPGIEGEPPSATMIESAEIEWRAIPQKIGVRIKQRHVGVVRPEMRDLVTEWANAGKPYPSSGGIYGTVPNKSYQRVEDLSTLPELRDIIIQMKLENDWLEFWDSYLPLRNEVSRTLLEMLQSGRDPDALSRGNTEAGTGLYLRGMRLKRKDLVKFSKELDFVLKYMFSMGVAFAATQIAPLEPDYVWTVITYDTRIKGAVASRSDVDVEEATWDGERLTIDATAGTRQVGSDCTGLLCNSRTEKQILGESVTERVLRGYRLPGTEYPFTSKELLLKMWATDAKPFPGQPYIIGEDLGLMDPVKAGADNLFSRAFLKIGIKVLPMMLSGSSWTQAVYSVLHRGFRRRLGTSDLLLSLGDDLNLLTLDKTEDVFSPWIKVKSTNPENNTKKILGQYSKFSVKFDPTGTEPAILGVVPRVLRTISSASKRSGHWTETLSNLPAAGHLMVQHPVETEETIHHDLELIKNYLLWTGQRHDLLHHLETNWLHIPTEAWEALLRHDEEMEHRIQQEEIVIVEDESAEVGK